jgi:hypothetical protein
MGQLADAREGVNRPDGGGNEGQDDKLAALRRGRPVRRPARLDRSAQRTPSSPQAQRAGEGILRSPPRGKVTRRNSPFTRRGMARRLICPARVAGS